MSSKKIEINYKTICNKDIISSKLKNNFHCVTINIKKDLGGVSDDEIENIWQQVFEDYNSGIILAATLGVELMNESRHLHVSMILATPTQVNVTQKRYEMVIKSNRIDPPKVHLQGGKEIKTPVTVVVSCPNSKTQENFRAYRWLAYALKEQAKEFNDVGTFSRDMNWTNSDIFRTIGMFDGTTADEERQNQFGTFIFTSWQKKLTHRIGEPETIWNDTKLADRAMRFMETTGFEMDWLHDDLLTQVKNQATIITKMVLNKRGQERYHLSKTFFGNSKKERAIYAKLCHMRPMSNGTSKRYEEELYTAIQCRVAENLGAVITSSREKKLILENAKLIKMNAKLKNICKEQVLKLRKKNSCQCVDKNSTVRNIDKQIAYREREYKRIKAMMKTHQHSSEDMDAYQNHKGELEVLRKLRLEMTNKVTNIDHSKIEKEEEEFVPYNHEAVMEMYPELTADITGNKRQQYYEREKKRQKTEDGPGLVMSKTSRFICN